MAVDSLGDTYNANLISEKTVSYSVVRKILSEEFEDAFLPQDNNLLFTDLEYSPSGTLLNCTVGNVKVSGQKLRLLFSLRSACISINFEETAVTFSVEGYGHGVGLSQYGADFMARQGSSWQEIIRHYYKGTDIMRQKQ